MTDPVLNSTTSTNRRWLIFSVWGLAAIAIGILAAKANYSPDLRGMLPGNDPVFVREMDFYARQGATRVLALEADGELSATRRVLTNAVAALKAIGVKPLDGGGAGAVARAAEIIRDHLPAFTTPESRKGLVFSKWAARSTT